jgi:hypothetical protein
MEQRQSAVRVAWFGVEATKGYRILIIDSGSFGLQLQPKRVLIDLIGPYFVFCAVSAAAGSRALPNRF